LLEEAVDYRGVRIASLVDIGCMKIDEISSRGTKRDFVELFFIHKNLGLDLKTFIGYFERKSRALSISRTPIKNPSRKCLRIIRGLLRNVFSSKASASSARFGFLLASCQNSRDG
jgi:hypothetical protein